jgi:hypothetical protein
MNESLGYCLSPCGLGWSRGENFCGTFVFCTTYGSRQTSIRVRYGRPRRRPPRFAGSGTLRVCLDQGSADLFAPAGPGGTRPGGRAARGVVQPNPICGRPAGTTIVKAKGLGDATPQGAIAPNKPNLAAWPGGQGPNVRNEANFRRTGYPMIPLFYHSTIPIRYRSCKTNPISRRSRLGRGHGGVGRGGKRAKRSQFAAMPRGTGPGGRGAWIVYGLSQLTGLPGSRMLAVNKAESLFN